MNYIDPPSPPSPPITPWQQAHCTECRKRATSTQDITVNFTECYNCTRIYCKYCFEDANPYQGITEAFRSTQICQECAKSNVLISYFNIKRKYKDLRKFLIEDALKDESLIARYILLFV